MQWVVLAGVVLGFLGSVPLTGPIAVLVVARSLEGRVRGAIMIGVGAALPEGAYAALAYVGFSAFVEAHPVVVDIARGVVALILIGLGVMLARHKVRSFESGPADEDGRRGGLGVGFAISAVNPTLVLTWTAALSVVSSMSILKLPSGAAMAFGVGVALGVGSWFFVLANWLGKRRERLSTSMLESIRRGMAVLVFGCGLALAGSLLVDL